MYANLPRFQRGQIKKDGGIVKGTESAPVTKKTIQLWKPKAIGQPSNVENRNMKEVTAVKL